MSNTLYHSITCTLGFIKRRKISVMMIKSPLLHMIPCKYGQHLVFLYHSQIHSSEVEINEDTSCISFMTHAYTSDDEEVTDEEVVTDEDDAKMSMSK